MLCRVCSPNSGSKKECNKCRYARRIKDDPIRMSYWTLKGNATRRGKEFKLTLEEFKKFCIETNYINKKGISKNAYHIDRINEDKGYTIDNIQLLTNSENVTKYKKWVDNDRDGTPIFTTVTVKKVEYNEDDCPF